MKVMVLGVSGMLGNAVYRVLSDNPGLNVFGTARSESARNHFSPALAEKLVFGVDVESHDSLIKAFGSIQPDVVVNCVGLVKQLADANDPLLAVPINTLLPHRLAALCKATDARLVHVSTDCVFPARRAATSNQIFQMPMTCTVAPNCWAKLIIPTRLHCAPRSSVKSCPGTAALLGGSSLKRVK